MNFTFWNTANGMIKVLAAADGGCPGYEVTFPDMESAQDFVIRILALNGNLPKEIKEKLF